VVERLTRVSERIWLLTELFHPDQTSTGYIMTRIAESLAQHTDVRVLCGPVQYDDAPLATQTLLHPRVSVHRMSLGNWDKNRLVTRTVRATLLTVKLALQLFRGAAAGDTIVAVTNPPTLLLLVGALARWRSLRLVVIVHDVFPENLAAARILTRDGLFYRFLRRLFDRAYRSADLLLVLGRDMQELLRLKTQAVNTERIVIVENWAETATVYPLAREQTGPVRLQFAGNLGRVQGLIPLLEAVRRADNPGLAVDLVGAGAVRSELRAFVERHALEQVRILPPFARANQVDVLNDCDIGIVSLSDGMLGLGVPSKAYNILAAGKPILFIGDPESEIARLVAEARVGWAFTDYGDALIAFLASLRPAMRPGLTVIGQGSRRLAEARYTEARQLDAYCTAILAR